MQVDESGGAAAAAILPSEDALPYLADALAQLCVAERCAPSDERSDFCAWTAGALSALVDGARLASAVAEATRRSEARHDALWRRVLNSTRQTSARAHGLLAALASHPAAEPGRGNEPAPSAAFELLSAQTGAARAPQCTVCDATAVQAHAATRRVRLASVAHDAVACEAACAALQLFYTYRWYARLRNAHLFAWAAAELKLMTGCVRGTLVAQFVHDDVSARQAPQGAESGRVDKPQRRGASECARMHAEYERLREALAYWIAPASASAVET